MDPELEKNLKALMKALEVGIDFGAPLIVEPLEMTFMEALKKSWDDSINNAEQTWRTPIIGAECSHKWKTYTGFTEKYDYCEHCDEKRKE